MLSAPVRRIGGFQLLRRGASLRNRRFNLPSIDGSGGTSSSTSSMPPSAAATEAVYAMASVAAASGMLLLGSSWDRSSKGGSREDQLASSRGSKASTSDSSSKTQPPPPPSRILFVSLSIVSFLPYINFAAFACLAAIESFRRKGKQNEDEEKRNLFSVLLSPAALAGFSIFYSLPFLLVALTAESVSGSEHSVFATASLVLGILHFQAIRFAGEAREEQEERRERAAAAEAASDGEEEEEEASAALFASLAASELERFDARLGLKTAKVTRLRELAQAAGVLGQKGRSRKKEEGEIASAPVARTKASLAAALAAAATLGKAEREESQSQPPPSFGLDLETRDWLTSELAKEVEPLVEKARKRRGGRVGKGAAAARALLEAIKEEEEG